MKRTHALAPVATGAGAEPGAGGLGLNHIDMSPPDPIFRAFLERQAEEGQALARASDILTLDCLPTGQHFIAHYACKGLIKGPDGVVNEADAFHVGISLAAGYLRAANPFETLTLFSPANTWHPNVAFGAPFICIGRIAPGMLLVDLLYQVYEVLTYQKLTMHDVLNPDAASWARANQGRFPIDRRALKRRPLELEMERI